MLEKMDRPDQLIFQIGIIKVWKDLFSSDLQIQKSLNLSTEALNMAGVERFELPTRGFGIRCSANWSYTPVVSTVYHIVDSKKPRKSEVFEISGGADGTRTRDPRRDRPVF